MTKKIKNLYIFKKWIKLQNLEKAYLISLFVIFLLVIFFPLIKIVNFETEQIIKSIKIIEFPFINIIFLSLLFFIILFNISTRIKKHFKKLTNDISDYQVNITLNLFLILTILSILATVHLTNTYLSYSIQATLLNHILIILLFLNLLIIFFYNKKNKNLPKSRFINIQNISEKSNNSFTISEENKDRLL